MKSPILVLLAFSFFFPSLFGEESPLMMIPGGEHSQDTPSSFASSFQARQQERERQLTQETLQENPPHSITREDLFHEPREEETHQKENLTESFDFSFSALTGKVSSTAVPPMNYPVPTRALLKKRGFLAEIDSIRAKVSSAAAKYHDGDPTEWNNLTDEERHHCNQLILSDLTERFCHDEHQQNSAAFFLPQKEMKVLQLQRQKLLELAQLKTLAAEKLEESLDSYYLNSSEENESSDELQKKLALSITNAQECISAWSRSYLFLKDYVKIAPPLKVVLAERTLLSETQAALRNWQARLAYRELLKVEQDASLLSLQIYHPKEQETNDETDQQRLEILVKQERKIKEVQEQTSAFIDLYNKTGHSCSKEGQEWWNCKLAECKTRLDSWHIAALENHALYSELCTEIAKKNVLNFLSLSVLNSNTAETAITLLNDANKKIEQEQEAWSDLAKKYIELSQLNNEEMKSFLQEGLEKAQQKQLLLKACTKEIEARIIEAQTELAYHNALQINDDQDELYEEAYQAATTSAQRSENTWADLKLFCEESAPRSTIFEAEWQTLLETAKEEVMFSQWKYLNFRKEKAIGLVNFIEKNQCCFLVDIATYQKIILQGKNIIMYCDALATMCEENITILLEATPNDDERNFELISCWETQYDQANRLKCFWKKSVEKWKEELSEID